MNTAIKSAIAACGLLTTMSAPLAVGADTIVFSGKGAFGSMLIMNENMYMQVEASEDINGTDSPIAYFNGSSYTGSECWYGYGSTNTIQFKATGSPLTRVTASGEFLVTWFEYCGSYAFFTETVPFTMDLSAITHQVSRNWGTTHQEYGNTKVDNHYDYSYAPAATNASSISSPYLGTVTPNYGSVGQSKVHDIQISQ